MLRHAGTPKLNSVKLEVGAGRNNEISFFFFSLPLLGLDFSQGSDKPDLLAFAYVGPHIYKEEDHCAKTQEEKSGNSVV